MQQLNNGSYLFSPSDLVTYLACSHATVLEIKRFSEPQEHDEASETDQLLWKKGLAHERAYLQTLKERGLTVAEIPADILSSKRIRQTSDAVSSGVDVVYQAALLHGQWAGYADFLVKTPRPSTLGDFSYEVIDTKLARNPEAKHVIQLCVYSDLLSAMQGVAPERTHLVLGDNRTVSFRVQDFAYYVRHAKRRFETFASSPPADSYPQPCAYCTYCHWNSKCSDQWEEDDHLSLVANIQHSQRLKLEIAGVNTLAALAKLPAATRVPDLNPEVREPTTPSGTASPQAQHRRGQGRGD